MSGEVKTYLINDERINVESEVEIAVKNSIQSGTFRNTSNRP